MAAALIHPSVTDEWPARWWHAPAFLADTRFPQDAREWMSDALRPDIASFIWWADAGGDGGFLMIYHQTTAEIGFWLSPDQRSRGRASPVLRRGLQSLPDDQNKVVMATVTAGNVVAERAARGAGMRLLAQQKDRTIFCLYRQDMR